MNRWTPEDFLEEYHLPIDTFNRTQIQWDALLEIGLHHESQHRELSITASHIASKLLLNEHMHSVRWRIKDHDHLMAKILRKQLQQSKKYQDISIDNYTSVITDLIGIRVLHLFKDDALMLDNSIRAKYHFYETPTCFYRLGDDTSYLPDSKFIKKVHDIGYRSIHYIIETGDKDDRVYTEIQMRTLFEEGWSEIDHIIRYPNLSDDPDIEHFLKLFNSAASFADEMANSIRIIKKLKMQKELQTKGFIDQLVAMKLKIEVFDSEIDQQFKNMEEAPTLENLHALREAVNQLKEHRKYYADNFIKLFDLPNYNVAYYQVSNDVTSERYVKGNAIIPLCRNCLEEFRIIAVGEESQAPCYNCGQIAISESEQKSLNLK